MSQPVPSNPSIRRGRLPELLRGEVPLLRVWLEEFQTGRLVFCLVVSVVGTALFGAAMGWWRAPLQALYSAFKFPLVILLTTLCNGLINALLAPLLGVNLRLRQSLLAVLISFTIAAAVLGGFSPVLAFLVWNTPEKSAGREFLSHSLLLISPVMMIAFAGIVANVRLLRLLQEMGGSRAAGRRVLFAWLAGNLLVGSQLSWVLRPLIGSPALPVQFLRDDAFVGSFYEAVLHALRALFSA